LNYAKAGFVTVSFQLRLSSLEDIEKVKRIFSQEADHNPCVLPHVKGEERRAISKVLEKASFRSLYDGGPLDMSMFEPQVSITDLQRTRTVVTVKVWIREVNRRDRILSDLLEGIGKRLREEGIEVADS
jgi:small-conductance mechanosensitive channel